VTQESAAGVASPGIPRPVTSTASVLLANNPSPMTLDGTNTWMLKGASAAPDDGYIVIDAGPADDEHLAAVAAIGKIDLILLTHRHPDHSGGSARLSELTGAPVYALDTSFGDPLREGDGFRQSGVVLDVIHTPGHSSDSLSFWLPEDNAVLTGDTILGRGTTVVAWPDGALGPYLKSLRRLREYGDAAVLPGHGPELPSAGRVAEFYLEHRKQRLTQVAAAVADGARTPREVVEIVYTDVDQVLWPAAELSVHAQLEYLVAIEHAARMAEAILVTPRAPG
jgi:glyoxylase-like metal-dependent hydrolase (beta-lactamase superfamily II)